MSNITNEIARRLHHQLVKATWIRSFLPRNAPIPLRCGVTIRGDLRHLNWLKMRIRGYHELDTERFLVGFLRPGDVVVDVGAHIGMITAVAAQVVQSTGKVYAFEVDDINFTHLQETIKRNALTNVVAEKMALNDQPGNVEFARPLHSWGSFMVNPENNDELVKIAGAQEVRRYTYQATTLDEYRAAHSMQRIDLIKIDVDGPELAILKGSANVLSAYHPALIVEASLFNPDHKAALDDLRDFLTHYGYRIFAAVRGKDRVLPLEAFSGDNADTLNLFCYLLGVHDERWSRLWFVG